MQQVLILEVTYHISNSESFEKNDIYIYILNDNAKVLFHNLSPNFSPVFNFFEILVCDSFVRLKVLLSYSVRQEYLYALSQPVAEVTETL